MSDLTSLLPVLIGVVVIGTTLLVFGRVFLRYRNSRRLLSTGNLGVASVVSSSQTGVTINSQPEMRVVLDLENAGGTPRRVEVKQVLDLGSIPRAGERVYVLIDPTNPANVVLAPAGVGGQLRDAVRAAPGGHASVTNDQMQDLLALTPELQKTNNMGVIKLTSVVPGPGGSVRLEGDIDAIGQVPRHVVFSQVVHGPVPQPGARTYVFIDPANPNTLALVPLSLLGGHTLPAGANRLDPLVLGPQLLRDGARASGVVTSAKQVSLNEPMLGSHGVTKWELGITVTPDNGQPAYPATLTISLLDQARVARITPVGAKLPLRYDPLDPQTFSIDSPALGYPDPYADLLGKLQQQLG